MLDSTTPDQRADFSTRIATALGPDWRSAGVLRGSSRLATVVHIPTGIEFVAVPGGTYIAGLRPDEVELMHSIEFVEDDSHAIVNGIAENSVPHEVTVAPFLIARAPILDDENAPVRLDDEQAEEAIEQYPGWRFPRRAEWEWVARQGGAHLFINGATLEETEDACKALYGASFDPDRDDAGQNAWGVWGLPWGCWICDDDEPGIAYAGRGGAAMLYPWQSDEIIMQLCGQDDDTCDFDEHPVRAVVELPANVR